MKAVESPVRRPEIEAESRFLAAPRHHGKGVQPAFEFRRQQRIHPAMALHARKAVESRCSDDDAVMRLTTLAPATMAMVLFALVNHVESEGFEARKKGADAVMPAHGII